ncbi:MAG: mannonate dehydratase [Verrucomicrobiae bacterium]|nr:mannonate dehydratase [Verrucomicrobiae bacterium]
MIVNPLTDINLQLAAQVGVSDLVAVYPGPGTAPLLKLKQQAEAAGLRLTHLERKVPHDQIVHGLAGRDAQIEQFKNLIRDMAETGMEVLCYNWMPSEDWCRTSCDILERGGAKVTGFDVRACGPNVTDADGRPSEPTPAEALWDHLERFLNEVIPIAEEASIKLALHPDDPPLPNLWGHPQIITDHAALERAIRLAPSPANGICYCTGSLGPTGEDLVDGIKRLGPAIHFAHVRNVRGSRERFQETWHDNGDLDLFAVIQALHSIGFDGTVRPDHAPSMAGESNETPGYEMQGRLFASGYLRGLMQAAARTSSVLPEWETSPH